MKVPLLDLQAQYATIRDEIISAVGGIFESQRFVLGDQVVSLEAEIARFCWAAWVPVWSVGPGDAARSKLG